MIFRLITVIDFECAFFFAKLGWYREASSLIGRGFFCLLKGVKLWD